MTSMAAMPIYSKIFKSFLFQNTLTNDLETKDAASGTYVLSRIKIVQIMIISFL